MQGKINTQACGPHNDPSAEPAAAAAALGKAAFHALRPAPCPQATRAHTQLRAYKHSPPYDKS